MLFIVRVVNLMIARAKITAQGQISLPAEVRKRLGVEPGNFVEFDEEDSRVVIRRAGRYTFEDIRRTLFPKGPPKTRTLEELKEGIAQYMRETHGHLVKKPPKPRTLKRAKESVVDSARKKHGRR
jgi:AbrB family looped-hinge helix DNA binding protein